MNMKLKRVILEIKKVKSVNQKRNLLIWKEKWTIYLFHQMKKILEQMLKKDQTLNQRQSHIRIKIQLDFYLELKKSREVIK